MLIDPILSMQKLKIIFLCTINSAKSAYSFRIFYVFAVYQSKHKLSLTVS